MWKVDASFVSPNATNNVPHVLRRKLHLLACYQVQYCTPPSSTML